MFASFMHCQIWKLPHNLMLLLLLLLQCIEAVCIAVWWAYISQDPHSSTHWSPRRHQEQLMTCWFLMEVLVEVCYTACRVNSRRCLLSYNHDGNSWQHNDHNNIIRFMWHFPLIIPYWCNFPFQFLMKCPSSSSFLVKIELNLLCYNKTQPDSGN